MSRFIAPWQQSDNFSVRRHQELVEGFNGLSMISPAGRLDVISTPGGRGVIDRSIPPPFTNVLVKITASSSLPSGVYNGRIGIWKSAILLSTLAALVDMFNFPDQDNVYVLNEPEIGRSPALHRMPTGGTQMKWCFLIPPKSQADNKPIAYTNQNAAVRDFRLKSDNTWVQALFIDSDSPTDDDWKNKIPVEVCTGTETTQLIALMES